MKNQDFYRVSYSVYESTLDKIIKWEKDGKGKTAEALKLYMVYYKLCIHNSLKFDKTINSLWATKSYIQKLMGVSVHTYRQARNVLIEMGLVSDQILDKKSNKYYFYVYVSIEDLRKNINENKKNNILDLDIPPTENRQGTPTENRYTSTDTINNTDTIKTDLSSKEDKKVSPSSSKKNVLVKSKKKKKIIIVKKTNTDPKPKIKPKIVKEEKKHCPKITKKIVKEEDPSINPFKKKKRKAGYVYTLADSQLYRALIDLGAASHKIDKLDDDGNIINDSYFKTMDYIHEILDPALPNPYNVSKTINDSFKSKSWTQEEIIDTFKYYMKIADDKKYVNIGNFILSSDYGTKSWSPLVMFFEKMNQDNGDSLEGEAKVFHNELTRLHIDSLFDARDIKRILRLMAVICNGYVLNPSKEYFHHGKLPFAFFEYVEPKLRMTTFKPGFIRGEKFIQQFCDEYIQNGTLVPSNGRC